MPIKANPMPALVQHMAGLVDGLDVASLGELKRGAWTAGIEPEPRSASPAPASARPNWPPPSPPAITDQPGICPANWKLLARLGQEQGRRPRVAVRVNPGFRAENLRDENERRAQTVRRGR
jgi:diaminopimelate decarboxylase